MTTANRHPIRALVISIGVLFVCMLILMKTFGLHMFQNSLHQFGFGTKATVAGTIDLIGLTPDQSEKGQVQLLVRNLETNQMEQDVNVKVPLQQNAAWQWTGALTGVNYQFQAVVVIDGKEVDRSELVVATAPAQGVVLPIETTAGELPNDVISASERQVSGTIVVNGLIPSNSSLQVIALSDADASDTVAGATAEVINRGTVVASISAPKVSNAWKWSNAKLLQKYQVVAVLKQGTKAVGVSNEVIEAEAGNSKVNFTVNSLVPATTTQTMAPPVNGPGQRLGTTSQHGTISGNVVINGPERANSSLLMLWRKPGDANYNVIARYPNPSSNGTAWTWTEAEVGTQYQIMAVLQVNDQNSSIAPNPITITAPATQVNFTLNTYYVIPATTGKPVLQTCLRKDSDNWNAIIQLPRIQGAGNYWLGVGNVSGQTNVFTQVFPAGDNTSDPTVTVVVQNNRQHFMRYSYSTCVNCSGMSNFAPPSAEVAFTCQ